MFAPPAMRPAVGTPLETVEPEAPDALIAPVCTVPWATPQTSPCASIKGVTIRVPPCRLLASPIADTVTSNREPGAAKAGRLAVTITAATSLVLGVAARVLTPRRSRDDCRLCWVKGALRNASPVPFRPTTMP